MQNDEPKKPATADFFMKFGVFVVLAVFGGLAIWSVVAPIEGAVTAGGQVVVEGNRKAVQHLTGGTVSEILVRDGALVRRDDIVIQLDDTNERADLDAIDGQLAELYARRARLSAERDSAPSVMEPSGVRAVLERASFKAKLTGQINLFDARRTTTKTQINLLEERIVQTRERIAGLRVQIKSLSSQIFIIEDELSGVRDLFAEGFASKVRLNELERASERLNGERGQLQASLAESESVISEAKLEINRLQETRREEAITELREVETRIAELEERRIKAADAFERTLIRAPYGGRVLSLAVHTDGAVIGPGERLMEIVPEASNLLIQAKIAPQDVDKVQAGQSTLIRFSAFGSRRTPETDGIVKTVSADSIVDEATGIPYYLVMVELPSGDRLQEVLRGNLLIPGMPVEAFIRTGKRPAISYLLKPLMDSFARSMREE